MKNAHYKNIAIVNAMMTACSNIDGNVLELYNKMNEAEADVTLDDIGIEPWQPFEGYELKDFTELVESFISTNEQILAEAAAPELLEALKSLMDTWECNPDHYAEEIELYEPLIAKAEGRE